MPLTELQADLPHVQSIVLSEDPSMLVQLFPLEQVLVEEVQKRPRFELHCCVPHMHVVGFAELPVFCVHCVHSGPIKQAHLLSVVHLPVLALDAGIN